jgi:hypothetical protein
MSLPVSIITPSFYRDVEACRLLCETIDAYVSGFTDHYIVVTSEDLPLFRRLAAPHRHVVAEAEILPARLWPIPIKWKGRRYRWLSGTRPIYGWHTQQLMKFAMAIAQPNPRVMFIDSDNFFVRPFDLAAFAGGDSVPLQVDHGAVRAGASNHVAWLETAHRLLGLPAPAFPADDFIGQMIAWDVATTREILRRIEATTGEAWWKALVRARTISEYMIYGAAVTAEPSLRTRHSLVTRHPCHSYWDGPALSAVELERFASGMRSDQSAMAIQSFTGTPIELLRRFALPSVVPA